MYTYRVVKRKGDRIIIRTLASETDVVSSIKKVKPKKFTGIDNLPAYIYKGLSEFLLGPIKHLFNLALHRFKFPEQLKLTLRPPIHETSKINDVFLNDFPYLRALHTMQKFQCECDIYIGSLNNS